MISYSICLCLTYFTKHNTLSPSVLLQIAKFHSFLQLISFHKHIYTYIYIPHTYIYIYIYIPHTYIYIYIYIPHTYIYMPHRYPFVNGRHLGWFHILAILWTMLLWTLDAWIFESSSFVSFRYIPRSGIAESYSNCFYFFAKEIVLLKSHK